MLKIYVKITQSDIPVYCSKLDWQIQVLFYIFTAGFEKKISEDANAEAVIVDVAGSSIEQKKQRKWYLEKETSRHKKYR